VGLGVWFRLIFYFLASGVIALSAHAVSGISLSFETDPQGSPAIIEAFFGIIGHPPNCSDAKRCPVDRWPPPFLNRQIGFLFGVVYGAFFEVFFFFFVAACSFARDEFAFVHTIFSSPNHPFSIPCLCRSFAV